MLSQIKDWMETLKHHGRQREDQVFLVLTLLIGVLVSMTVVAFIVLTERLGARLYPVGGAPWRRLLVPIIGAVGTGYLLFRYAPTDSAGVLWVMCGCALMAVAAGAFFIGPFQMDRHWIAATAHRHWGFSKWTTGNSILRWLSSNLIILMSGSVLGPQAIGAIRASINVLAPRNVLILGLTNIVLVKGSRKYQTQGAQGLRRYLAKVTGLGLGFDVCVAIFAASFADQIMYYLYGPDFVPYSFLIYWIACINIIHFFSFPVGLGLQIIEHTRPFFVSAIIEAVFGVCASYFLVKWFDLPGTMAGLAVANVILLCCLVPPLVRRLRR